MKKLMIMMALLMAAVSLQAQTPVGTEISSTIPFVDAVAVLNNTTTEVAQVQVDSGCWLVSGLVNLYEQNGQQYLYAAADISSTVSMNLVDGKTSVQSVAPTYHMNNVMALSIPTRLMILENGGTLHLLAWNLGTLSPVNSHAFGFISAVKIAQYRE